MSGCLNPEPYYPRSPDGTCPYWRVKDTFGNVFDEPQCTYWMREAWRSTCESMGLSAQKQRAEQQRRAALTPEERAHEDGRLF